MTDVNALVQPFAPILGPNASTVSIAATGTTGNVALPVAPTTGYGAAGANPSGAGAAQQYAVWNTGSTYAFVAFGGSAVAATVPNGATPGSFPIAPSTAGRPTVVTVQGNPGYVAAIMASSTGTIYICPGNGGGA
jgi:hypothetical protein